MTDTDYRRYKRMLEDINVRIFYMRSTDAVWALSIRNKEPWSPEDKRKLPQYMQFAVGEIYRWEVNKMLADIQWPLYFRGNLYLKYDNFPQHVKTYFAHARFNLRVPVFTWQMFTEGQTCPYALKQVKGMQL